MDSSLVRKLLVARPGRRYSQEELFQSQRNLYESDLFRFAAVNIDSTAFQPGADSVPLLVQVNEGKRRRIRGGLGYATNDCFRGSLGWTSRDFLGGGRILDLTSRVSKVGVGAPLDWGLADNICSASRDDIGRVGQGELLPGCFRAPAGVPLAQQRGHLFGFQRAALGVQGLPAAGDRCQHRALPARRRGGATRFRSPTRCPTGEPRPPPRASARSSTPVPPTSSSR